MSPGRYSGDVGENHSLPALSPREAETLDAAVAGLAALDAHQLRLQWRNHLGGAAPILGRKLYLIDVLRKRLDFHKIEPAILHMKDKFKAGCVVLETAGVGLAIGNAVVKREGARRWLCPYDPTLGKLERAIAQTPKIERKRIYLPVNAPWLETFEAEVATFPMSKYFDQVDSMVQFLYLLDHRNRWTMDLSAVVEHREQPF